MTHKIINHPFRGGNILHPFFGDIPQLEFHGRRLSLFDSGDKGGGWAVIIVVEGGASFHMRAIHTSNITMYTIL